MSSHVATTKMSSRGQVVIPEEIRKRMGITEGSQFMIFYGEQQDVLMLKRVAPPSQEDVKKWWGEMLSTARLWATRAGLDEDDITSTIAEVRKKKSGSKKTKKR